MTFSRMIAYAAATAVLALSAACFRGAPEVPEQLTETGTPAADPATTPLAPAGSEAEARRNTQEIRRRTHLNVVRLAIDRTRQPEIRIAQRPSSSAVSRYAFERKVAGTYYVTKQGVLLCEEGPCTIEWTVKFLYTDESGKVDAFLLQGRDTIFGGMGPTGTSKSRMDWCLNGDCQEVKDMRPDDARKEAIHDRYALFLTKNSMIIRRVDIMKEVLDAGRKLSDY